jgi:RHS repeat-associated protein
MGRLPHLGSGAPGPNVAWDHKDRLLRADIGGGGAAFYVYDGSGERVRKVWEKAAGLVEEHIYLGGFEIFRRHGGAIGAGTAMLQRETLHVMDDRRRVALVETRTLDVAGNDQAPRQLIRYQLNNQVGSSCLELDQRAQIVSYEEYAPFGSSTYQAVRSRTETAKRYRSTGKERDEESGLYYHGARYAIPWLGRWSSTDPSGIVDGLNLYRYCRNNPVALSDPTGKLAGEENLDPETMRLIAATVAAALTRAAPAAAALTTTGVGVGTGTAAGGTAVGGLTMLELAALGLVAAQALAAVAEGLAVRNYMQRSASIVRYGNPYGVPKDDFFPVLRELRKIRTEPYPEPQPRPKPKPDADKDKDQKPRLGRIYVTYTKYNTETKRYYSGRTSAVIDLDLPWAPQADAAVAARDANHHKDESTEPNGSGFLPAQRDQYAVGYAVNYEERYRDIGYVAIRGREQQLIDYHGKQKADELGIKDFKGGAQSDTRPGTTLTENAVRGVAKDNLAGEVFHRASDFKFGPLAPFTGDKVAVPSR